MQPQRDANRNFLSITSVWIERLLERPWIIWLFVFGVALIYTASFPWAGDDTFEMIATVRAASENLLHPRNPMLDLPGDTSPRFTPYSLVWAIIVRVFGANPVSAIQFSSIVNLVLFATGLTRFVKAQFADQRIVSALVPIMLVCWGTGYAMANGYYWFLFFISLTYVAIFAYGVGFHALAELANYLETKQSRSLTIYASLCVIVFLSHPITGVFIFMIAGVMALFGTSAKRMLALQLVPFAAMIAVAIWPYFDYVKTLTSGSTERWYTEIMFDNQLRALGVALVGIPLAVWYGLQRKHLPVVLLLVMFSCGYFLSWALDVSIGARFLIFAAFTMHLLIALYFLETFDKLRTSAQPIPARLIAHGLIVLAVLLVGARMRGWEIKRTGQYALSLAGARPAEISVKDRYLFLEHYLGTGDIVLAEGETGWPVPGMTGARLVFHQHGNPLLVNELETRLNATTRLLMCDANESETRETLNTYRVTHVLVDLKRTESYSPRLFSKLAEMGRRAAEQDSLVLFRVGERK